MSGWSISDHGSGGQKGGSADWIRGITVPVWWEYHLEEVADYVDERSASGVRNDAGATLHSCTERQLEVPSILADQDEPKRLGDLLIVA
jgi:hypothetical protein